jgi:hypothetical protein
MTTGGGTVADEREALQYSRVMAVRAAPQASSDELLAAARRNAPDPEVFSEFAPVFFHGEISSTRWDAWDTSMHPSSLKNYATDAESGVAFLRNHDTGRDPEGHSIGGRFIAGGGNGVARVESDFYLIPVPESRDYIAKLRAGIVRDLSIGFYGGTWRCTLCQRDMAQWFGPEGCPHILGMTYTPMDEAGTRKGEAQKARAVIEDARLAEFSGVYDGATPGAMISKARSMAADGALCGQERDLVQVRYRLELPEKRVMVQGADLRPLAGANGAEENRMPDETTNGTPATENRAAPDPNTFEARFRALDTRLRQVSGLPQDASDPLEWLISDRTRLAGEVETLSPLAEDGRAYRTATLDEALAAGVRALGDKFNREAQQKALGSLPLDTVREMRDVWNATGDAIFAGGRRTQDGPGERAPAERSSELPAAAHRA